MSAEVERHSRLMEFLSGDKARKIIIAAGIILILLLFFSTLSFGGEKDAEVSAAENPAEIELALEQRLERLVSSIDGAGSAVVMVTLETTSEHVYAEETRSETSLGTGTDSSSENRSSETSIATAGSGRDALEKSVIQPKVRGVAVVCAGASDPVIKEKVTKAVSGVLNIGVSQVCVTC